jgi:hypothetical protein
MTLTQNVQASITEQLGYVFQTSVLAHRDAQAAKETAMRLSEGATSLERVSYYRTQHQHDLVQIIIAGVRKRSGLGSTRRSRVGY